MGGSKLTLIKGVMGSSSRLLAKKPAAISLDNTGDDEPTPIGSIDGASLRSQSPRAHLVVLAGNSLGRMFRLDQPVARLGWATEATIRLEDEGVSRRHAKIVQQDGEVSVEDLKSAKGTRVNGRRVTRAKLEDGDRIQMGAATILKFTYSDRLDEGFHREMIDAALRDRVAADYDKRSLLERLRAEIAYAIRHKTPLSPLMLDVLAPEGDGDLQPRSMLPPSPARLQCGALEMDRVERRAVLAGSVLQLTRREFAVLLFLADRVNRVVRRADLLEKVWNVTDDDESKVDHYVTHLRRKLGAHAGMIETIHGVGYCLRPTLRA